MDKGDTIEIVTTVAGVKIVESTRERKNTKILRR